MKYKSLFQLMRLSGLFLIITAVIFTGCSRQVADLDESDFRDPEIRKAQSKIRQGDKDGGIVCLNNALKKRPNLAQAHLLVALLYNDYKKDYVRAMYHFQRYLELRPSAQKRGLIEDLIRQAKMSFAASLSEQVSETTKKIQALEEENSRLKASIRELRNNLAKLVRTGKSLEAPRASKPLGFVSQGEIIPPAQNAVALKQQDSVVAPASTVYRVQEGDTLSLISAKIYHDPRKWKAILDANSSNLVSSDKLRVGQVLIIPQ
ncbi:LysM peptidoglycan-binding domain-containing protein [Verrucomicrobiota bacterium]